VCRHLGYLGPPVPLGRLLFDPPHSLAHQSWAPADMRGGGTINADGFGVVWYGDSGPVRIRRDRPLWSDADLPSLAGSVSAGAVLAAVRSATVGMPVTESAAAPFLDGRWAFSHNGVVAGWPDSVTALAARLPLRDLLTLEAPTDAALLWALVRHRLRGGESLGVPGSAKTRLRLRSPGATLAAAVRDTAVEVAAAAPGSRLNLLATDGDSLVATALGHALSVRTGGGATLVASEPLDADPAWRPVPDGHLLVATPSTVDISPLPTE
jgi:gamma-glutamyl hercynylcysteine S-oxide hydrolase